MYAELVMLINQYYCQIVAGVVQWFTFNSHIREAGESIAKYVAKLRRVANLCNYGLCSVIYFTSSILIRSK